jgi:HEAT repeat protein
MADVSKLAADLASDDAAARATAAEALAQFGAEAQPAAIALVRAIGDANEEVREQATAALEELGPPRVDDLPALLPLLKADKPDVAFWAATLIGRLGSAAVSAVPALAAILNGTQAVAVRQRVAWALGQIGPGAAAAAKDLQKASANADPRLARLANEALAQIQA